MWILNFLPDWIFYFILLAGIGGLIASYLMKFIPFVYMYRTPIQLVSIVAIVGSTFMVGAAWNDQVWRDRVAEMEEKVAAAEVKSVEENVKIVTKIVKKTEIVRTKGEEVIKYIDREVVKYNERCEIPNELVNALNNAAEFKNE
jgi:hypothetical protein